MPSSYRDPSGNPPWLLILTATLVLLYLATLKW